MVVSIWGTTYVFTKILLLNGMTPAQIMMFRFSIAYIVLLTYCLRKKLQLFADNWKDELMMLGLGTTGGSMYFLAENESMRYTSATNTSLILCLSPLFASILISSIYRVQRPSRIQVIGSLMALAGVTVVLLNGHFVLKLAPLGDSLAIVACLCWAVFSLLMVKASKYPTIFLTRKIVFYALISMIPFYIAHPAMNIHLLLEQPRMICSLLYLGWGATTLCTLMWNWASKNLGVVKTTNYIYLSPVVTIIFAWLVLSETITLYFIMGTVLILVGMYFSNQQRLKMRIKKFGIPKLEE